MKKAEAPMDIWEIKDHTVSGKKFDLLYDPEFAMYRTSPKPSEEELPSFYDSEEYISHTDARVSIKDKLYHVVKKWMLHWKVNLLSKYNATGKLLDVGAGTGDFLGAAKNKGWEISGVEPSSKARVLAKSKGVPLKGALKEVEEQFDAITLWHVLEHVHDLPGYISFLKRNLLKDGTLYIAVPNYNSYEAEKYGKFWAAYDVPRHLYHFSKTSIQKLFEQEGFELVAVKPLIFDAFYVSLLSEYYKNGKYRFARALFMGLRSNLSAWATGEYSSHIYVLKSTNN